jgi:hypothetical protein
MKRRKHRLVVEFTTSEPMTEHEAAWGLRNLLDRLDISTPIRAYPTSPYAEKLAVKEFSRVLTALKRIK